jgi:hypothetical protein
MRRRSLARSQLTFKALGALSIIYRFAGARTKKLIKAPAQQPICIRAAHTTTLLC